MLLSSRVRNATSHAMAFSCVFLLLSGSTHAKVNDLSGEWSVKWCDKDRPSLDCGIFVVYLAQENDKVCGSYEGASVGLARIDEGSDRAIFGAVVENTAVLFVTSSRSGRTHLVKAVRKGGVLHWKSIGTTSERAHDVDVIAVGDTLRRRAGSVSDRRKEVIATCSEFLRQAQNR